MATVVSCPTCGKRSRVKLATGVKRFRCPGCGGVLHVELPAAAPWEPAQTAGPAWHVMLAGNQSGPFSKAELGTLCRASQFRTDTQVWREGMAGWVPAGSAPELADLFPALSCPPPPPPAAGQGLSRDVSPPAFPRQVVAPPHWGLVVLAVFNFMIAIVELSIAGGLLQVTRLSFLLGGSSRELSRFGAVAALWALFAALCATLLTISGVGYLRRKRSYGYGLAHAYAVVALAGAVLRALSGPLAGQLGWALWFVNPAVDFGYPVLTLVLLNTVFKGHFRR